jgi:putative membrane protein
MATPNDKQVPPHLAALSGFLMGGADAVPGVSGGTIALIIGIYERFIESLSAAVRTPLLVRTAGGRQEVKRAFALLVPLGVGLLLAYFLVTKLLVGKTEDPGLMLRQTTAPICYGFFFGLVLFSLREPWRRIRSVSAGHVVAALIGCAAAALFVGLPYRTGEPESWMILLGGAGAIAVMLLPGISGSLLLVILGLYTSVAGAVHDRDVALLAIFAAGMAAGVLTFVPLLKYLLRSHHDVTMAALTGLMAGSLRALWPWKNHYDPKNEVEGPMSNIGVVTDGIHWVIVAAVAGALVVWLLAMLERRILAVVDEAD